MSTTRTDAGSATALSLSLGFAVIVFPVMVVVLSLPVWEQRAVDAEDAARAGALALATAPDWPSGVSAAEGAVLQVLTSDGVPAPEAAVAYGGKLVPGADVTVTVTVAMPAAALPGLGAFGNLHYRATSTEHVDSYRSSI